MENRLRSEYKMAFDNIYASNDLRRRVLDAKPSKHKIHIITPLKATIGTVAAAVMIFAAVHEYGLENNTSGVISETVVSTQLPRTQFVAVNTVTQAPVAEKTTEASGIAKPKTVATPKPVITEAPVEVPVETSAAEPVAESGGGYAIASRLGGEAQVQESVSVTECEPFDEGLSGTIVAAEFGFKGYKISGETYYIIEGTDEAEVLEKMNTL